MKPTMRCWRAGVKDALAEVMKWPPDSPERHALELLRVMTLRLAAARETLDSQDWADRATAESLSRCASRVCNQYNSYL